MEFRQTEEPTTAAAATTTTTSNNSNNKNNSIYSALTLSQTVSYAHPDVNSTSNSTTIFEMKNWGIEKLSKVPKVTKTRIWT